MTNITQLKGGLLVSNRTLRILLQVCLPRPLTSTSTLFDAGIEEQKRVVAELLQKEFNIQTGFNPARDLMRSLNDR